jgi:hypothetical protein
MHSLHNADRSGAAAEGEINIRERPGECVRIIINYSKRESLVVCADADATGAAWGKGHVQ